MPCGARWDGWPPGAACVSCGAILHNTSYGKEGGTTDWPEDHNLYYVNIAWDGFQRGNGAGRTVRGTSRRGLRGKLVPGGPPWAGGNNHPDKKFTSRGRFTSL